MSVIDDLADLRTPECPGCLPDRWHVEHQGHSEVIYTHAPGCPEAM